MKLDNKQISNTNFGEDAMCLDIVRLKWKKKQVEKKKIEA